MSVRLVPKPIIANSERQAQIMLLVYQVKTGRQCNTVSIYQRKDGKTVLWFMDEMSNDEFTKEMSLLKPAEAVKR